MGKSHYVCRRPWWAYMPCRFFFFCLTCSVTAKREPVSSTSQSLVAVRAGPKSEELRRPTSQRRRRRRRPQRACARESRANPCHT
ncbi:hypothetical protein GGS24DRAFT_33656 [Hypoxylon argillaceum]|nr:hypothetical protein GGS24DRAFT_33656 [Hypoxylon argillaceum]